MGKGLAWELDFPSALAALRTAERRAAPVVLLGTAFMFMFVLVLAANLFADAVRDGFDPRVRVRALPAGAAA